MNFWPAFLITLGVVFAVVAVLGIAVLVSDYFDARKRRGR